MIHVFMKHISSFQANIVTLTEQVLAPFFHENHYKSKKFFHQYHTAYQSKLLYPWKFEVKLIETTQNDWCGVVSFAPLLRIQNLRMGLKCSNNYILSFYYSLSYTSVNLIRLTSLALLKSPWWLVWTFFAMDLLKGAILSSTVSSIIHLETRWKNFSPWLLL